MRYSYVCLTVLLLAAAVQAQAPVQQIELPKDFDVSSKQRVVRITAKISADPKEVSPLEWIIDNVASENGVPLVVEHLEIDSRTILLFPNDVSDVIRVGCYTAIGGKPTKFASVVITVVPPKRPGPSPGPTPNPAPGPSPSPGPAPQPGKSGKIAAHVSIISGRGDTILSTSIAESADLKAFLAANGVKLWMLYDDAEIAKGGFAKAIAAVGLPCAVVQDATGNVIDAVRLTDAATLRATLTRHTR